MHIPLAETNKSISQHGQNNLKLKINQTRYLTNLDSSQKILKKYENESDILLVFISLTRKLIHKLLSINLQRHENSLERDH